MNILSSIKVKTPSHIAYLLCVDLCRVGPSYERNSTLTNGDELTILSPTTTEFRIEPIISTCMCPSKSGIVVNHRSVLQRSHNA